MRPIASPEEREQVRRELKGRILNVLPAATFVMDKFLSLADVTLSDEVGSAGIEIGPQPRMLLAPDFVEAFCKRDEHLLMLVMHELYHVILGHTRVFKRTTLAHNIAFDALINAKLCCLCKEPVYAEFFQSINPESSFPSRLLRPPRGWPAAPDYSEATTDKERVVVRRLFSRRQDQVTYWELMDLIKAQMPDGPIDGCTLIGDHDGRDSSGAKDGEAAGDLLFRGILQDLVRDWPEQAGMGPMPGKGGDVLSYLMPNPRKPRTEFIVALKQLLKRAGFLQPDRHSGYQWARATREEQWSTVIPHWGDRRAEGWSALYGEAPLIYRKDIERQRPSWVQTSTAHVYFDISGSMNHQIPWLASALGPLERSGACRLFVFSTVIDRIERGCLSTRKLRNTGGTDIRCVYEHFLSLPKRRAPARVVILTDGHTGTPTEAQAAEAKRRGIRLYVGLVGRGAANSYLGPYAHVMETLPALR